MLTEILIMCVHEVSHGDKSHTRNQTRGHSLLQSGKELSMF